MYKENDFRNIFFAEPENIRIHVVGQATNNGKECIKKFT
jgi:hypothetical protein